MMTKDVNTAIQRLISQASDLAEQHAEELARRVMRKHKSISQFCMGMGTAAFYDKDGHPMDHDNPKLKEFYDFIWEWDSNLKLTGSPMKFTADGPKITDW